jgi:hypothetical protein
LRLACRGGSLYGFEAFDLTGSGGLELIAFDDRQYLRIHTGRQGCGREGFFGTF